MVTGPGGQGSCDEQELSKEDDETCERKLRTFCSAGR